jgi:hypothetical protein
MRPIKLNAAALIILLAISAFSCKKVSDRKLDGEWDVTSGETKITSTNASGTTTTETKFDGTEITGTIVHSPANPTPSNQPSTTAINTPTQIVFKFDKKNNSYIKTTTRQTNSKESEAYYQPAPSGGTGYVYGGFIDRFAEVTTVITEQGYYRITGGTGDVKKNSQILLISGSVNATDDYKFTYYNQGTTVVADLNGKYKQKISGLTTTYVPFSSVTTESVTTNVKTEQNNSGIIWTVNELRKGVMDISYTLSEVTEAAGITNSTTSNTEIVKYKLTEK